MASMSIVVLPIILSMMTFHIGETTKKVLSKGNVIRPGSSLSPTAAESSWSSPSGNFEFGFYQQGNGFSVGIWLIGVNKKTVVWTANRDDTPVDDKANLLFTDSGKLLLRIEQGYEKPIADISNSASSASMLDSGNFVLYNNNSGIVWESFEHPTDTMLQDQVLLPAGQLFSSVSETNHSTGRFHLKMQDDGNLVLYPSNTEDWGMDAYWASDTWSPSLHHHLHLNSSGVLRIVDTSSWVVSTLNDVSKPSLANADQNSTILYRATLDANGNFQLYSHVILDKANNGQVKDVDHDRVSVVWSALQHPCEVKGVCGFNSLCIPNGAKPKCVCVPGTEYADPNRRYLGCLRNYSKMACGSDGKENVTLYSVTKMENISWQDIPYEEIKMSNWENCSQSCLEDCNCEAAIFELNDISRDFDINTGYDIYFGHVCMKQKLPLRYVKRDFKESKMTFFKVSNIRNTREIRNKSSIDRKSEERSKVSATNKKVLTEILVIALGFVMLSCVALAISGFYIIKIRVLRYKKLRADGTLGNMTYGHGEVTLRVFSYNELKRATNGFKEELGKGSFGAVYKGSLNKGKKVVAVKRLEKLVEEGEREFQAEMRAIGRTNHKNLVRLLGYCAEASKRLLVYEYMSNGSLADLLFANTTHIGWEERVRIAIDVARGILYLHEECKIPIIHCDIKPQNILMDDFWTAKISDFGLAKFLMPDQTRTFTAIRGTRGYLAPEWQKNTPISVKADVYSFGIVLLEIVCCRKNMDTNVSDPEEIVLSNWVYKCFAARELKKLVIGEEVDNKILDNMVKVGLWCIQDEPALRPSMKSVVLMLEGISDVSIPPCPTST